MRALLWFSSLIIILKHFVVLAEAAPGCPRYVAPGMYKNPPAWGDDSGIIIDGHAELWDVSGPTSGLIYAVEHGTDLSKFDFRNTEDFVKRTRQGKSVSPDSKVDYGKLRDCGTKFAFSRIAFNRGDPFYGYNAKQLKANDIANIPYYFFPISRSQRDVHLYINQTKDEVDRDLQRYARIGDMAAEDFLGQLRDLGMRDIPSVSIAGVSGQLVALDIEQKACATNKGNCGDPRGAEKAKVQYGRYYAKATCTWIKTVREKYPDLIVVLYTTPSVWGEYLSNSYPDEYACLQDTIIWIARTTVDGGDSYRHTGGNTDKEVQRLCRVTGGDRCLIHQYTHRAELAGRGRREGKHPLHIDVERFFEVQTIPTNVSPQYVRSGLKRGADGVLPDHFP
jgi:hypothetical protein